MTAPVIAFPRSNAKFIVDCDASDYGLGAVIPQERDGSERVIAYASRVLDNRERRYSTTNARKRCLLWFTQSDTSVITCMEDRLLSEQTTTQ